jgi:hypothetical protein
VWENVEQFGREMAHVIGGSAIGLFVGEILSEIGAPFSTLAAGAVIAGMVYNRRRLLEMPGCIVYGVLPCSMLLLISLAGKFGPRLWAALVILFLDVLWAGSFLVFLFLRLDRRDQSHPSRD